MTSLLVAGEGRGLPLTGLPRTQRFASSDVMINGDGSWHWYCAARGEILRPVQDYLKRRRLPKTCSPIMNESQRIEGDQIPP